MWHAVSTAAALVTRTIVNENEEYSEVDVSREASDLGYFA